MISLQLKKCTTMAFLCYPFLQLENVESLISLNVYTILHNSNLEIHGFWPKALKIHGFLKKKSIQYIGINLTKCGFEQNGFFLEPKTAHLKALLYSNICSPILKISICDKCSICSPMSKLEFLKYCSNYILLQKFILFTHIQISIL